MKMFITSLLSLLFLAACVDTPTPGVWSLFYYPNHHQSPDVPTQSTYLSNYDSLHQCQSAGAGQVFKHRGNGTYRCGKHCHPMESQSLYLCDKMKK